jgi:hypothetical protein
MMSSDHRLLPAGGDHAVLRRAMEERPARIVGPGIVKLTGVRQNLSHLAGIYSDADALTSHVWP